MGTNKGQAILELLLSIGVLSLILPAMAGANFMASEGAPQQNQRLEATFYLREAREAVRVIREAGWDNIATAGTYHPQVSGGTWSLVGGAETIDQYTRTIEIRDVERDAGGAIVPSGSGTPDPSTKEIEITVSWDNPIASEVTQVDYIARFLKNDILTDTTVSQFGQGVRNSTVVTDLFGGEVVLGAGSGNWCSPRITIDPIDLPNSAQSHVLHAIERHLFAVTSRGPTGVSFADVTLTNDNPPTGGIRGTYTCCKTNDIYGDGEYVYLATDNLLKEVIIVDIRSAPYSEVGHFNSPGLIEATAVTVSNNRGYMAQGTEFRVFNLDSKVGARAQIGPSITLAGRASKIMVVDSYAYIAIEGSATKLQIIDVSDPNNPLTYRVVSQLILPIAVADARDLYVNESGTRVYLATGLSLTAGELFIVDTSLKVLTLPVISIYDAGGMDSYTVAPGTNNKILLGGVGGEEYQVLDLSNELLPIRCGGLQVDAGIYDMASIVESDGDVYAYVITGEASAELKIIEGGSGGSYVSSGTFESRPFVQAASSAYNRITASIAQNAQTEVKLQVAAADMVAGTCTGIPYHFVGPDTTSSSYFTTTNSTTIDGVFPMHDDGLAYENPARCMKYKAFMETDDFSQSPVLYDVNINYSP